MKQMVPCVISINTTHGTVYDISIASKPEWFSNLFFCVNGLFFNFPVWPIHALLLLYITCETQPTSSTQSRAQCWGMCVPAGTGAAPWRSPCCAGTVVLAWRQCHPVSCWEPLPWEPAAHCSISIATSAGLWQPRKFKKVILTQSNDVLSSQLPCLKIYSKEELIVPKWSSLFCLYKQSGTLFGLFWKLTQRRKLLFSLSYNQKWEILSYHIPSEKSGQIYLEQEYPIYWDCEVQAFLQRTFWELWSIP